jgi:hypothetical protein
MTIRAHCRPNEGATFTIEAEKASDLFDKLEGALKMGASAVVRLSTDAELFDWGMELGKLQTQAQRAASLLTGAKASSWAQALLAPDTDGGWRIIANTVNFEQQPQPSSIGRPNGRLL